VELDAATLRYSDESGEPVIVRLNAAEPRMVIGRSSSCDVVIGWDLVMSREHALLELIGSHWYVSDDGMSRHGTYIRSQDAQGRGSEHRIRGRHRFEPGDRLVLGQTILTFRPAIPLDDSKVTRTRTQRRPVPVTPAQRNVLHALCEPMLENTEAAPASNRQIALRLTVSVDVVKDHLQELYRKFGVKEFGPGEKRRRLAQLAIRQGLV
jgi:pSer/pThr/pTyr-binding forkhead associated (FHA) protein